MITPDSLTFLIDDDASVRKGVCRDYCGRPAYKSEAFEFGNRIFLTRVNSTRDPHA